MILSIYGAYTAGHSVIKALEVSYFGFLEEFQDNDRYITELENDETGPLLHDFLTYYAWDLFILSSFMFWHIFFLIGTGAIASGTIYSKITTYVASSDSSAIKLNQGWRLLILGVLFGSVNLLAGNAITFNQENIMKLVGFTPTMDTDDIYTKTTEETEEGVTTISTFVTQNIEIKKNFFAMSEILDYWGPLYIAQRILQLGLPYFYVMYLEVPVFMVFVFILLFS